MIRFIEIRPFFVHDRPHAAIGKQMCAARLHAYCSTVPMECQSVPSIFQTKNRIPDESNGRKRGIRFACLPFRGKPYGVAADRAAASNSPPDCCI